MPNTSDPIARVYAAALVELGREKRTLGQIHDDLNAVHELYVNEPYFRGWFLSPRLDRRLKWPPLKRGLEGKVGRPVLGLLNVLIDKGRESAFDNIVAQFARYRDEAEHRIHADVTVATPLADETKSELTARLGRASGLNVVLHEKVDPAVLGGASIRIGDRVIDRTLRTRLAALRRRLVSEEMGA